MKIVASLTYIGPNRRANTCLIENLIELSTAEQSYVSDHASDFLQQALGFLHDSGVQTDPGPLVGPAGEESALEFFALLYAAAAIAIQQSAGHRVQFMGCVPDSDENRVRSLFEYEHVDVGDQVDILARKLLAGVMPGLEWDAPAALDREEFARSVAEFREFAEPFILPPDTQAIINAAACLDIPCVKLERDPYKGLEGDFRIRKNSMLKLGHSVHQHIVDGTFCVDRGYHLLPLLGDRQQLFQFLNGRNIPDEALRGAILRAHRVSIDASLEEQLTGEIYRFVVANGKLIGVLATKTRPDRSVDVHEQTIYIILGLVKALGAGLAVADVRTPDICSPLSETGGAIVNLDLSPELDTFLPVNGEMHRKAMTAFLRWLFPTGSRSRIPLVTVTGTNGKTTTCRMISHIMQAAGHKTGLACSDGIYINGELQEAGDSSGQGGHHRVLESHVVDMGVLETARGALAHSGFMYDWSNVAVCLNVTVDHLGEYGVETLEQMADLKRSVLDRARDGVVLFADDGLCAGMLPLLSKPRTCLVSLASSAEDLKTRFDSTTCFSVIEKIDGSDWMVLHDGEGRTAVTAVNDVPATFAGQAIHNISNALHALSACYLMGADVETIRAGLQNFKLNFDTSPGRLNFYDEHPFRVLLDYAHNADGFTKLSTFVSQQEVPGRKILMMQARGDYGDEFIIQLATATAGYFDHYVCRSHPVYPGPDPVRDVALMKQSLLNAGVADSQVTTTTDPEFAVDTVLGMGSEGDLLVFTPGADQRVATWERILSW